VRENSADAVVTHSHIQPGLGPEPKVLKHRGTEDTEILCDSTAAPLHRTLMQMIFRLCALCGLCGSNFVPRDSGRYDRRRVWTL